MSDLMLAMIMNKFTLLFLLGCWFVQPVSAIFIADFEILDLPLIPQDAQPSSSRMTPRVLGSTAASQGYYEYLPPGYDVGNQDYPLLLFIHGLGENGDGDGQLQRVLNQGPPKLISNDDWDTTLPFVVLSPQRSGGGCTSSAQIRDFIAFAKANYAINDRRIYLTGLSCGAIGSWNYLRNHSNEELAAMVPIAGDGRAAFNAAGCALGTLPLWAFHGDADGVVGVNGTRTTINQILSCDTPGPDDVSMVIYPGVGHDSWTRTYNGSAGFDIYQWLLTHKKP